MKLRSRTRNKIIIKLENPTIDITQGTSRTSSGDKKDIQNYQLPDINLKEEDLADKKIVIKTENHQIQADNILEETNNEIENIKSVKIEIKQELMTKPEELLKTMSVKFHDLSNKDYHYRCRICNERRNKFMSLLEHRKSAHNVQYRGTSIKHFDLEPDIHDVKNYCQPCEMTFSSIARYRSHLQTVHCIMFRSQRGRPQYSITPDSDDPNFHCRSCIFTYPSIYKYRIHLKAVHGLKLIPLKEKLLIKNPDIIPEWNNPTSYCVSCEYTLKNKSLYHRHCKNVHHMKPPTFGRPDLNNPNCYCKICNITLNFKTSFTKHCLYFHSDRQKSSIINPSLLPDVSDPNNYCRACEKTFTNECSYRLHLRYLHKLPYIPNHPRFRENHKNITLDINDPNCYCSSCDRTLSSKRRFKYHIIHVHFIGARIPTKGTLEPDIDDPNFYCLVCKRKYATRHYYRSHIRGIHKMILQRISYCSNNAKVI